MRFEGQTIHLGDRDFVVPALTIRAYRKFRPQLGELSQQLIAGEREPTEEEFGTILAIVHTAIARNYPELTVDELEDIVDLGNLPLLVRAALGHDEGVAAPMPMAAST